MQNNQSNLLLAFMLSATILISWTWFYQKPRTEKIAAEKAAMEKLAKSTKTETASDNTKMADNKTSSVIKSENSETIDTPKTAVILAERSDIIKKSEAERITISSDELHGSINLKGAKFDDLTLVKYHQTIDDKSPEVALLSPSESKDRYFADFGWISSDSEVELPKPDTIWQASNKILTPQNPVTLSWQNKQNILFLIEVKLDEHYMFSIAQSIKNNSGKQVSLAPYGRVNRFLRGAYNSNYILHEGPIGVFDGVLKEFNYKKIIKENNQKFTAKKGWLGITDKYWITSIIPDQNLSFDSSFTYSLNAGQNSYNTEFVGTEFKVANNEELKFDHLFFAGAKKVTLLDEYAKKYDIALFDRAVDFGWYYFLTKPFFFILKFFNEIIGNYGLAILAMTVLVKLLMYPMAHKSFSMFGKMKTLQPKIEKIRKECEGDKMKMNKEIMELYKKEKINPASGCLPMLIQIPVFFSLYKVLYVTIDMRHAPFYGWIKDLSAPDPTSIFNLFGLLPFETPGFLMIGIWPILMGLTMVLQQKVSPQATDPTQAKVMKMLPYFLIFVFASFPAGLLIYWTWSNILSVAQQWYIGSKIEVKKSKN